ncbi:cell division protein FtsK [Clostridium botulinum]|nr:cell division protein FtsK [Clostridium botulinum]
MIVESATLGLMTYIYYRWTNKDYYRYKFLINDISNKNNIFKNSNDDNIKFIDYRKTSYSDRLIIDISKIIGYEKLESQKDYLKSYFNTKDITFKKLENGNIQIDLIKSKILKGAYEPVNQQPYELLVGYNHEGNPILINFNSFPHMLIGGDSGTGKSRFLLMALSNLIAKCNIDLYLLQIRKSDLIVFKDCRQCKYITRDLKQTKKLLKYLNDLCIKRDKTIETYTISKGIYNIEDYNRYFKYNNMKYSYIVLDEFSFFNPNGADKKEVKQLKKEILGYIKNIVMVGRSIGVFIITSLQKPTNSSIPSDIKSQLTTRVCFKMLDESTSIQILGNGKAEKLEKRECIVRTLGEEIRNIAYIDHKIIMKAINNRIESNKRYIDIFDSGSITKDKKEPIKVNNDGIINLEVFKNVINK